MPLSFDIFCRVVDNYGDIGVCWRLARRLASHPGCSRVRLWVDNLASFARIAPGVKNGLAQQDVQGIEILHWSDPAQTALPQPADVVIEAFGCTLPDACLERLSPQQLWINLEYLSAEDWVESCHGLPSIQPNGLRKFFFFPGFTAGTGGLLRETGLISQRDTWQADPQARLALLQKLGVEEAWLERLQAGAALVYVFCYPQAPLASLMQALSRQNRDTLVLCPQGVWPAALPGQHTRGCRIDVRTHEFVDQDTFDRLLWSSDLNIVRGEDSLVRAIWAGRAMLWQPYRQQDDTHLDKLDAWLSRAPWPEDIRQAMLAWNQGNAAAALATLPPLLHAGRLQQWQALAHDWCAQLTQHEDLADQLLDFCTENSQTR